MTGQPSSTFFRPRRIGVTGALRNDLDLYRESCLSYCAAIGQALVDRGAVVVTRGGKQDPGQESFPVDWPVVQGAAAALETAGTAPERAIETVLSEAKGDREQFHVGTIARVGGRTYEAERFAFVDRLDGLVGIAGQFGTEQALVLALATERPVLPVALFGGAAAEVWKEHRDSITDALGIDETRRQEWTELPDDTDAVAKLGKEMIDQFIDSMARHCFVIMPYNQRHTALYDFVIEPAVTGLGDEPIRVDHAGRAGDVGRQIEQGIQRADYVIVVLDDMRPNVLYELGLAHGVGKQTILLNQRDDLGDVEIPFDLTMEQRLEYDHVDRTLPTKLQDAIRALDLR